MKMHKQLFVMLATSAVAVSPLAAQTVFTTEHLDLSLRRPAEALPGFPSGWELYIHDHDNELDAPLTTSVIRAQPSALQVRPAGSQWDFLGVSEGEPIFVLPQSQDPELVYLGIGAEDLLPNSVEGNMELRLDSVNGPGSFSLYQVVGGGPVVFMASADGVSLSDSVDVAQDSHVHYNWAFTQPGVYDVGFRINGTPFGSSSPILSEVFTVRFEVIPEPGSLLIAAGAGVCLLRRRR